MVAIHDMNTSNVVSRTAALVAAMSRVVAPTAQLRRFLTAHLAGLRGCSPNTIVSYRDAFKLLICYFRDERSIPPERLTLELIDSAAITGFLDWLRTSRHNSAPTSNQRLAPLDSFYTS